MKIIKKGKQMKITKTAYNVIKENINEYYSKYDFPESYEHEFVNNIKKAKIYFSKDYEDLEVFEITEKCLNSLLDIVYPYNQEYVLELLDQSSEKLKFEVYD
jgi:hypothetical protein